MTAQGQKAKAKAKGKAVAKALVRGTPAPNTPGGSSNALGDIEPVEPGNGELALEDALGEVRPSGSTQPPAVASALHKLRLAETQAKWAPCIARIMSVRMILTYSCGL